MFKSGPLNGVISIIDMRGSRFGHLFRPSISSMRKGLKLLQEGCPMDLKAVHVLNTFPFVNAAMCELVLELSVNFYLINFVYEQQWSNHLFQLGF